MRSDRLNKLADLLDTVKADRFDMNYWGLHHNRDAPDTLDISKCGTSACAMGWACSIPEFRAAGLSLKRGDAGYSPHFVHFEMTYQRPGKFIVYSAFEAAAKFFEIALATSIYLFAQHSYHPKDLDEDEDEVPVVTPADVAERIRELIANGDPNAA